MQSLVTLFEEHFIFPRFEPSIELWELQSTIEGLCSRLRTAKLILRSIAKVIAPRRSGSDLVWKTVELAAKAAAQVSKCIERQGESRKLSEAISRLTDILHNIQLLVKDAQSALTSSDDWKIRQSRLTEELTELLESIKDLSAGQDNWKAKEPERREELPQAAHDKIDAGMQQTSYHSEWRREEYIKAASNGNSASHFAGAHNVTVSGGTFNNILGDYIRTEVIHQERMLEGIVKGSRVFTIEDISAEQQIFKGRGYRFYSGQANGKVVAMKVYQGSHARQRSIVAATFGQKVFHPNIPRMIGVSPHDSELSFLVFDGDYEGIADYMLEQALRKGLDQSLTFGLRTIVGLSSALDYLNDMDYPFEFVDVDHFIVLSCRGNVILHFDPEEALKRSQVVRRPGSALNIFHSLCQRVFDAASKTHYENERILRTFDDYEAYTEQWNEFLAGMNQSNSHLEAEPDDGEPEEAEPTQPPNFRPELVWKPRKGDTTSLDQIAQQFQRSLNEHTRSSSFSLQQRKGRTRMRTPHRCHGYGRIEITLTPDIKQSALVSHQTPNPHEICSICREVVQEKEAFKCACGQPDDGTRTVKCAICNNFQHRRCALPHLTPAGVSNFACKRCKMDPRVSPELHRTQLIQRLFSKEYLNENALFKRNRGGGYAGFIGPPGADLSAFEEIFQSVPDLTGLTNDEDEELGLPPPMISTFVIVP